MKKATKAKSLHAFLLTGVLLAACSNDDSVTEQRNVLEAGKTYYMSVEATKGSDEDAARTTRALTIGSDGKLSASWSKDNDHVFLRDHDSNLRFTSLLKPSNDGSIAWLNGTVTPSADIPNDGTPISVTLIFPRKDWTYNELEATSDHAAESGQLGTLEDIAARFDYSIASAQINKIEENSITSYTSTTFAPQQAIVKFTLLNKDNNDAALIPTRLRISASGLKTGETETGDITITPAPNGNTNVIYAALRGISGARVTLTATVGDKTYIYNKAGVTFAHGSFYPITVKMHEDKSVPLANVTTEHIGHVVGTDGWVYAKASDVPEPYSAVAMVACVGSGTGYTHGLAVALTDESGKMNQNDAKTAASTTKNSNTRVENGTWRLPSKQDWKDMFIGCGGRDNGDGTMDCSAFNSKLATVSSALSSTQYWTSTNNDYLYVSNEGATATFSSEQYGGISNYNVRAVLSF